MIKALRENEKYPLDSSIIQQWIIKSIRKNKKFLELIFEEGEWLKYLTEAPTKKTPAEDVCRKNVLYI